MEESRKNFIYFVLIAPLLTKIIEWCLQWATFGGLSHLSNGVWFMQIIFIETMAIIVYGILTFRGNDNVEKLMLVPGIAYFLKEVYNLIFVYKVFTAGVFIAIFVEPVVMYFIVSFLFYKLFIKDKKRMRKK